MAGLRVGLPAGITLEDAAVLPPGVEAILLPREPREDERWELDVWVPPFNLPAAKKLRPHVSGVRLVQCLMAGVDWLKPMVPEGAVLCDGRGVHDIPVAEWIVAGILAHLRRFPAYFMQQQHEQWRGQQAAFQGAPDHAEDNAKRSIRVLAEELYQRRVLIVGYGSIGEAVEKRLAGWDVSVTRIARTAREGVATMASLDAMLPDADVVVLLLPLTSETKGLFDARRLALMRDGALLVNAARGAIVDSGALVAELNSGRIAAVLDVTDPEPLPAGNPLWTARNCMITPHTAGGTAEFLPRAMRLLGRQCERLMAGERLENVVVGEY